MAKQATTSLAQFKRAGLMGYKGGGQFVMVAEHDGANWLTNSFALVRGEHFSDLFAKYNLKPEIGKYEVNGTIGAPTTDATLPNVGALMKDFGDELAPFKIAGHQAYAQVGDYECMVFGTPEAPVAVKREIVDVYFDLERVAKWTHNGSGPVWAYTADGTLLGGVMQYRLS